LSFGDAFWMDNVAFCEVDVLTRSADRIFSPENKNNCKRHFSVKYTFSRLATEWRFAAWILFKYNLHILVILTLYGKSTNIFCPISWN
jgi:hypothetical protein